MTDWASASDTALRDAITDDTLLDAVMAQLGAHDLDANTRTYDMGKSALYYARKLGWPVFPLVPGDKRPATAHGFHDATRDLEQITAWWTRWPDANIATPTGSADAGGCGYDVIDVDIEESWPDPHTGFRSWAQMLHEHCPAGCCEKIYCPGDGSLDIRARAVTPRGGRHYYLPAQGSRNATNLRPGVDVRGTGGYVALAPSYSADHGRRYTWVTRPEVAS